MEITSTEILKKLPDFDDLLTLSEDIANAVVKKLLLDKKIKEEEAKIIRTVLTNSDYFVGGKPPSMTLIESTYSFTGLNGELIPVREEYAIAIAEVDRLRSRLELYKEFLGMWRSLNASERAINA